MAASDQYTLHDFVTGMLRVRELGPTAKLLGLLPIPGLRNMIKQARVNEAELQRYLARIEAIYHAMTPAEQDAADRLDSTARREIAARANLSITDVSSFLCSFEQTRTRLRTVNHKKHNSPAQVLGLVTQDRFNRDPSFIYDRLPRWQRLAFPLAALITAMLLLLRLALR